MLLPNKMKHRKVFKGKIRGKATRGNNIAFGEYAIQALGHERITSRQIESARQAMTRYIKRGGKIWIRIFPDWPITAKPLETRQGSGKGAPVGFVAPIKPGRVLYEIDGVSLDLAKEALTRAAHKLPVKTVIVTKEII